VNLRATPHQVGQSEIPALAGMLSSDGYVSSNRRDGRFGVSVCLVTTVSANKACTTARLLRILGFHCLVTVSKFKNPFTRRQTIAYGVIVNRRHEVVSLFFRIFPYLVKPSRTQRWIDLLGDPDFYRRVIMRSKAAHLLLRDAAIKRAGSSYRYLHVLVKLAASHGIEIRRWSGAKHWSSGKSAIPLPVLVDCCNILGEDILNHIPSDLSVLLWLHRVLGYQRLISLRNVTPILKLDEMAHGA